MFQPTTVIPNKGGYTPTTDFPDFYQTLKQFNKLLLARYLLPSKELTLFV
jgi:hypothetical protein